MLNDAERNLDSIKKQATDRKTRYAGLLAGVAGLSLAVAFLAADNRTEPAAPAPAPEPVAAVKEARAVKAPQPKTEPAPALSPRDQAIGQLMALAKKEKPSRNDVRAMQKTLNALGYDTGKADGVFYRKTAKGFTSFLKDHPDKTAMVSGWVFERLMFQGQRKAVMEIAASNPAVKSGIETRMSATKSASSPDVRRMQSVYAMGLPAATTAQPEQVKRVEVPVVKPAVTTPPAVEPKIKSEAKAAPKISSADPVAPARTEKEASFLARAKELAGNEDFRQALKHNDMDAAIRIMKGQDAGTLRIDPPVLASVSSAFMATRARKRPHQGIDYPLPTGTPVKAAAAGIVVATRTHNGYGPSVLIDHGSGVYTRYAHLSRHTTKPGAMVHAGQIIAKSGNRGRTTGPHLHFETLLRDRTGRLVAVDPQDIMGKNLRSPAVRAVAISEAHADAKSLSRRFHKASAYARLDHPATPGHEPALTQETALLLIAALKESPTLMASVDKGVYRRMIELGCRDELMDLSGHATACLQANARRRTPGLPN